MKIITVPIAIESYMKITSLLIKNGSPHHPLPGQAVQECQTAWTTDRDGKETNGVSSLPLWRLVSWVGMSRAEKKQQWRKAEEVVLFLLNVYKNLLNSYFLCDYSNQSTVVLCHVLLSKQSNAIHSYIHTNNNQYRNMYKVENMHSLRNAIKSSITFHIQLKTWRNGHKNVESPKIFFKRKAKTKKVKGKSETNKNWMNDQNLQTYPPLRTGVGNYGPFTACRL